MPIQDTYRAIAKLAAKQRFKPDRIQTVEITPMPILSAQAFAELIIDAHAESVMQYDDRAEEKAKIARLISERDEAIRKKEWLRRLTLGS